MLVKRVNTCINFDHRFNVITQKRIYHSIHEYKLGNDIHSFNSSSYKHVLKSEYRKDGVKNKAKIVYDDRVNRREKKNV